MQFRSKSEQTRSLRNGGDKRMSDNTIEIPEHELQGLYSTLADATEAAAIGNPNGCANLAAEAKQKVIELHEEYAE